MAPSIGHPPLRRNLVPRPLFALLAFALAAFAAVIASTPPLHAAVAPSKTNTFLIEAEALDALGCWEAAEDSGVSFIVTTHTDRSRADASTPRQDAMALGGFTLPAAGTYTIWACSRNYGASSTNRRFKVWVDDIAPDIECGAHSADGWRWEAVKTLTLAAGNHTLKIEDATFYYARLDAILITSADLDPNAAEVTRDSLNTYAQTPLQAARAAVASGGLDNPSVTEGPAGVAAELRNQDVAVRFRRAQTAGGQPVLLREIEFLTNPSGATGIAGQTWRAKAEPVHLLRAADPIQQVGWAPKWKNAETENWNLSGTPYTLAADRRNSFLAGDARAAYLPDSIAQTVDARTVRILYKIRQGVTLDGAPSEFVVTWSLPDAGHAARMQATLEPSQAGHYSLAFAAGGAGGFDAGSVAAVQLPPLYQFKRAPALPIMLMSSVTPHPLALVETHDALRLTHGVIADPDTLATEWAGRDNATHGFSLRGREGEIQPAVFTPILGARGSQIAAGGTLSAAWWVMTAPVAWSDAMRAADTRVLKWRDYREPWNSSLTSQAVAIINLIKSGRNFRWYDNLKGPSNIEAPTTATHSAPLMLVSAALLSRDADFYKSRGLPALEFMLSRAYPHFALTTENNSYVKLENDTRLTFAKNRMFGAALWQGFDALSGGLNPWILDYMTDTAGAVVNPGGVVPKWSDKLALYRARLATDPSAAAALLAEIKADARTWAAGASGFGAPSQTPREISAFYHTSFYPYWWDLLDLHELTGDADFLDYAKQGAALTTAGMWVHPIIPADNNAPMTLYAGGTVTVTRSIWWDGDARSRVGFPTNHPAGTPATFAIPQKTVPAWLPATAGLSLEQPSTYFTPHGLNNIQNTTWAANLLRLYGATGDDYWRAHARNALIGRGGSYPGYYLTMYMDLQHATAYTDDGPDLTSFYWHHAPVHLAMLVDFLVTDADARTNGAIRFPYAKSQGYVWFSSRVYGGAPGKIFDDNNCWLWLDDKKFNVDTLKIDFLGARSEDKFHLVLLNQARDAVSGAKIFIDTAALRIAAGAPAQLRDASGNITSLAPGADGKYTISLAQRGWAVLTFDAAPEAPSPSATAPALETRPIVTIIDSAWGDMHAFRIRSPHGADSLYIGLTGVPAGGRATLLLVDSTGASRAVATKTSAPYELTATDIAFGDALRFKLQLETTAGGTLTTPLAIFPGTKPATPAGLAVRDAGNGAAALAWTPAPGATAYNIKRATTPAGPFQNITQLTAPAASDAPVEYTDANLTDNQDYYYRVSAVNSYGETPDSAIAGVSIVNTSAPRITAEPLTQNAEFGKQLALTVATSETGVTYQWYKDGAAIVGATSATLTLSGSPTDAGVYTVRVTGRNGSTLSDPATIGIVASQDGPLLAPAAVTADAAGIVYVADEQRNTIYTLTPPGSASVYITPIAGSPGSPGTLDATGTLAQFNRPLGLAVRSGTLYVADFGNAKLRAISSAYDVTTHAAGNLGGIAAIATDALGNIYAADKTAHVIRKIDASTGAQRIIAGTLNLSGTLDATGTLAQFDTPSGIAFTSGTPASASGYLYIADTQNHTVRKIDLGNAARVTTVAGLAKVHGCADGLGDDALFNAPEGIAVDGDGTVYVADTGNHLIREISPSAHVTTLAGNPGADGITGLAGFVDATGTRARFNAPRSIALGSGGQYLYVADTGNRVIRRIDSADKVQTLMPIVVPSGTGSGTTPPTPAPPDNNTGGGGGGGGAPSAYYLCALLALAIVTTTKRRP